MTETVNALIKQASNLFMLRCTWGGYSWGGASSKARERLPITDSVGQHRSDYQLSVAGVLRQSTGVVSDSFF